LNLFLFRKKLLYFSTVPVKKVSTGTAIHVRQTAMKLFDQIRYLFFAAAAAVAAAACADDGFADDPHDPRGDGVTVCIGAAMTRTAIGADDGGTMQPEWSRDDRIFLWAKQESATEYAFENAAFDYWHDHAEVGRGFFAGRIPAPMAAGTYNYYAAYPRPAEVSGTQLVYEIPAVQRGVYDGSLDIMLAQGKGPELHEWQRTVQQPGEGGVPEDVVEDLGFNDVGLMFRHKVHALKITVPEGRNRFDRPISRLRIAFFRPENGELAPAPVAGRLTMDAAAPDAAPVLAPEGAADAVTVVFDRPIGAGDTFWVFVAPVDLTGGEVVFTATDGTEFSYPISSGGFGKCEAGQITPVSLTVPALRPQADYTLTVAHADRLGEPVTQIESLAIPGCAFPSLELLDATEALTYAGADDAGRGRFTVRGFVDQFESLNAGKEFVMKVSSENTEHVVGRNCTVQSVSGSGITVLAPYLFFEDFSKTTSNDAHADDNGDTAYGLDDAGLAGWTGSRWKVDQQSLEFRTYISSTVAGFKFDDKFGRIDTPALIGIKGGRKLTLNIQYKIGAKTDARRAESKCIFGVSEKEGAIAGGHGESNSSPDNVIDEFVLDANGSPTNMPTNKQHTKSECTNKIRLTWVGSYKNSGLVTGKTFYFYLDNIRVTIVP